MRSEPPRPQHPNGWPVLDVEPPELPKLSPQPTMRELVAAYATMATAFHWRWPQVVSALEWLKARAEQRSPSEATGLERVEGAAKALSDYIDDINETQVIRLGHHDSDRVRQIWAEENQKARDAQTLAEAKAREAEDRAEKAVRDAERAKMPMQIALIILSVALTAVASYLLWHLGKVPP